MALLAFCADGYLFVSKKRVIHEHNFGRKGDAKQEEEEEEEEEEAKRTDFVRFLSIATRIPFDVQTVMCNILAGSSRQFIASKLVEMALKELAQGWV